LAELPVDFGGAVPEMLGAATSGGWAMHAGGVDADGADDCIVGDVAVLERGEKVRAVLADGPGELEAEALLADRDGCGGEGSGIHPELEMVAKSAPWKVGWPAWCRPRCGRRRRRIAYSRRRDRVDLE